MTGTSPEPSHRAGLSRNVMVGLHMQITPALVRELGGNAAAACVLAMIMFRTQVHGYRRNDGRVWWKASMGEIARDTGLSRDQVNRLLGKLVSDGYVLKEQHYRGIQDQTASYSIVFDDGPPDLVTENPGPDRLWITPEGGDVADSPHAGQSDVAESPHGMLDVAIPPRVSGDIATTPVAIPPSLPIRSLQEKSKKKGGDTVTSPGAVDNFAPPGPLPRPERCVDHQREVVPPACGRCKDARLTLELVEAEVAHRPLAKCEHNHVSATCPYCPGGRLAALEGAS